MGWIGIDLDGTLAYYDKWKGIDHIGDPIPTMVTRVRRMLAQGKDVRIFTARVADVDTRLIVTKIVKSWCLKHIGQELEVTCIKDFKMEELWDDRCVQVIKNDGRAVRISANDEGKVIIKDIHLVVDDEQKGITIEGT